MNHADVYRGQCFCGAVLFTLNGEPAGIGYDRRECPVNAFGLWKQQALHIVRGACDIGAYNTSPHGSRHWCKWCGGYLYTEHPRLGLVDVHASILECFAHEGMSDLRISHRAP